MEVDRKVVFGLVAGAVMTILAWLSKTFAGIEIPGDVYGAGSTLIVFFIQWKTRNEKPPAPPSF
jgi:hypothetical protein